MGPLPSASSREAQPERMPVAPAASAGSDEQMLGLGQLTVCLCAVLRDARAKGTISEIFSPPRVAAMCMIFSFCWTKRNQSFLEGRPPCGPFSSLQSTAPCRCYGKGPVEDSETASCGRQETIENCCQSLLETNGRWKVFPT